MFDWVSGYRHVDGPPDPKMSIAELRKAGYLLDNKAWLNVSHEFSLYGCVKSSIFSSQRILFLESIAGVPGMVAATLRHLTSLRLMVNNMIRIGMGDIQLI